MSTSKLKFGWNELAKINSVEDLEKILIQIRKTFKPCNPIIEMIHENNRILYLAISPEGCYLDYVGLPSEPPYYSSLGDRTLSLDDGILKFQLSLEGHVSEVKKRNIVSFEELLRVAKAFFISGEWPEDAISWEMD